MLDFFLDAYKNATAAQIILEAMAFASGIASVWLVKK